MGLIFRQKSLQGLVSKNSPLYRLSNYANSNFTKFFKDCKLIIDYYFFSMEL